ncbi:hypothetical protein KBD13_00690 [Patescibacteria group bacterium]|nr:hypothetical protein [Patescibacteria group bacterium]
MEKASYYKAVDRQNKQKFLVAATVFERLHPQKAEALKTVVQSQELKPLHERMWQEMVDVLHEVSVVDPTLAGRACARFSDARERQLLIGKIVLPPDLPAHSLPELRESPPMQGSLFWSAYFQERQHVSKQAGSPEESEYMEHIPLRVNLGLGLYTQDARYLREVLEGTHEFSDGVEAQITILRQVMHDAPTLLRKSLSLPNGAESRNPFVQTDQAVKSSPILLRPEVLSAIEAEDPVLALDIADNLDKSVVEMILNILKKNQESASTPDERKNLDQAFFRQMVERGKAPLLAPLFTTLSPEMRDFIVEECAKKREMLTPFLRGLYAEPACWGILNPGQQRVWARHGWIGEALRFSEVFKDSPQKPSQEELIQLAASTPEGRSGLAEMGRIYGLQGGLKEDDLANMLKEGHESAVIEFPELFIPELRRTIIDQALLSEKGSRVLAGALNGFSDIRAQDIEKILALNDDDLFLQMFKRSAYVLARVMGESVLHVALKYKDRGVQQEAIKQMRYFSPLSLETFEILKQQGESRVFDYTVAEFIPEAQAKIATLHYQQDKEAFMRSLPSYNDGIVPGYIADEIIVNKDIKSLFEHRAKFGQDMSFASKEILAIFEVLLRKIQQSPSRSVRRLQEQLSTELLEAENPIGAYDRIESIFLRNHIPLAGKIFLTFDILHKDEHFETNVYSPTLIEAGKRERKMLIYKDLINIHLDTGNPEMKAYLEDLRDMSPLLEKVEQGQELEEEEVARIEAFFRQVEILRDISVYGTLGPQKKQSPQEGLRERLRHWKASLGARAEQTFQSRIEEMFLLPAGVRTIDEALARMEASKARADTRNRELINASPERVVIQEGDLLKGVESAYFLSYLQRGNVAGELLGYAAKNDATRMDTDTGRVLAGDLAEGNLSALQKNPANGYGNGMVFLVRPTKERFFKEKASVHDQIRGKTAPYELFSSPVVDSERHFGIRTGFPFTEVSAIILRDPQRRQMLDIKMDLVANGYYVPIIDTQGVVLFSPEEFDQLRELYAGSEVAPESVYQEDRSTIDAKQAASLEDLQTQIEEERIRIESTREAIERRIEAVLQDLGIALRTSGELAVGAEMMNTGSTARRTSIPGEVVDFDLVIRLDESDMDRQEAIKTALTSALPGTPQGGATAQWRRTGVDIGGIPADIDVTFVSKPEVEGVPSHAAAEQRLRGMERLHPESADWVRANIVYAKKMLKKAGAYKKLDGGLGGLGVENWILQHGGSFAKARDAFLAAAIGEDGAVRPFEECAARYTIPDPGINLIEKQAFDDGTERQNFRHDDFFHFLNKQGTAGYTKMVQALQHLET